MSDKKKSKPPAKPDVRKPVGSIISVQELFRSRTGMIKQAAAKHLDPERMARIALVQFRRSPALLKCTGESIVAAMLTAAQWGLEPDGRNAHLVPYGPECTLIPDYKGLVMLARRSGEVSTISAEAVYENDLFRVRLGTDQELEHEPCLQGDRGEILAFYSAVRFKDGGTQFVVMTLDEVEEHRDRHSQAYRRANKKGGKKDSPWHTDFPEMGKKTVFRRLSKWLTLSPEFQDAVIASDREELDLVDVEAVIKPPETPRASAGEAPKDRAGKTKRITREAVEDAPVASAPEPVAAGKPSESRLREGPDGELFGGPPAEMPD